MGGGEGGMEAYIGERFWISSSTTTLFLEAGGCDFSFLQTKPNQS
jgi:hypothetical protein